MKTGRSLRFFNTLTRRVEPFEPLEPGRVRLYTCGPTVYDFAHIGNFRTYVWEDLLRRLLKYRGLAVTQAMNITDVEDKIIRDSLSAGVGLREFTERYIKAFFEDLETLSIEKAEFYPRATDHIPEMVELIQTLAGRGCAYESAGSIYFRIAGFPGYGRLSKLDPAGIKDGARVDSDDYEKDNARDFVLWKARKEGEPSWSTPLGEGRPGWHIECSAMSMKYLGSSFDIHTGGVDNIFPHHENEIAQSEAATGQPFVRCWLHSAHLMVDGQKMSKSKGNFYTLRDLLGMGLHPQAIRYFLMSSHYRKPLNFTLEAVGQAGQALARLHDFTERLDRAVPAAGTARDGRDETAEAVSSHRDGFDAALDDDMNTAEALAALFEVVRLVNAAMDRGEASPPTLSAASGLVRDFRSVFGITPRSHDELTKEEAALVAARQDARMRKDYAEADRIRGILLERGIVLEDTAGGARVKRTR